MTIGIKGWYEFGSDVKKHLTSEEAIKTAKLDYHVDKKPLFLADNTEVPSHFATVRTDTNDILGVVGNRYTVLQNKDAFRFFDSIVGVKEAIYETAGAFNNGRKVWLLAKLPGYIQTLGDDITEKYLLLYNSHDGSGSIQVMFTPIRIVCKNTLNVAVGAASNRISLRHTQNVGLKVNQIQEQLGIVNQRFSIFEEASKKLATVQLTKEAFSNYIRKSGLVPDEDYKKQSTRAKKIIDKVTNRFENGRGSDFKSAKGTLWGAFNAIAEYTDHYRGVNEEKDNKLKQSEALLFGSGAVAKQKAWKEALTLAR